MRRVVADAPPWFRGFLAAAAMLVGPMVLVVLARPFGVHWLWALGLAWVAQHTASWWAGWWLRGTGRA